MNADSFTIEKVGACEITLSRNFAAARALVYRAWTTPALVRRWLLGPPDWTMPVCEIDLTIGGRIRYVWRHTSGKEMGLTGIFREIEPATRLVHTEVFDEDWTGGETLVTTSFTETAAEGTLVRISVLYASTEARDAASRSGMEAGVAASYDRLDAILAQDAAGTRIVEVSKQTAMVVRKTIPMTEMRAAQQAAHAALAAAGLGGESLEAAGPRLTIWRMPQDGRMDYAPGRLVAQPAAAQGEIESLDLPAGRAAHLTLVGGYEGLPGAWGRLFEDCAREKWTPAGLNWEIYDDSGATPVTDLYALLA